VRLVPIAQGVAAERPGALPKDFPRLRPFRRDGFRGWSSYQLARGIRGQRPALRWNEPSARHHSQTTFTLRLLRHITPPVEPRICFICTYGMHVYTIP